MVARKITRPKFLSRLRATFVQVHRIEKFCAAARLPDRQSLLAICLNYGLESTLDNLLR